ncbi:nitrate reductase cytochrome c-type subunit [Ferrimonas aestuarii]|uniref:Periplasmic nitrate reductase, electron transfer subunit n=1 Tax=Ferrimonas aestuarii TaxID=2569539 RepID=A0A4U1BUC2_9GAMM|nr:nitrate reductase cytochrome c-type subunit [Ferrimonas aestuarii]TKB57558.1 nitrate reductase [Ferrimonas aestuarii]
MKKTLIMAAAALLIAGCQMSNNSPAVNDTESRRGDTAVNQEVAAAPIANYPKKNQVAEVYQGQPPLIPHKADYKITTKRNNCLSCHKPKKQTLPMTHVEEGKVKGQLYQCRICHLPQADNLVQ